MQGVAIMENRIAKFEKVSFEQFKKDWYKAFGDEFEIGNNLVEENIRECYDNIRLPRRATKFSAGYDFYLPFTIIGLEVGAAVTVPTGIRCAMDDDWVLMLYPRSGHGFKYGIHLGNTVGVVDADFYFAENEGHIHVKLVNDSVLAKDIDLAEDTAFCQGIFLPYGITIDDDADGVRKGGFGSTDKK